MKYILRFLLPLMFVMTIFGFTMVPVVEALLQKWFLRDIEIRSQLIASTIQEPLSSQILSKSETKIATLFNQLIQDERLYAVGFCDFMGKLVYKTATFPQVVKCRSEEFLSSEIDSQSVREPVRSLNISFHLVKTPELKLGELILIHDVGFLEKRSADSKRYVFYFFAGLTAVISLVTVFIAQLSRRGWVEGMRSFLKGEGLFTPLSQIQEKELVPLAKDLRELIRDLQTEVTLSDEPRTRWTAQTLKKALQQELSGEEILVVSNREPYIHFKNTGSISVEIPASGLVTALEPVMRACSGTWIAHGSGDADREVVDQKDHIAVPPENPRYQLRRLWLSGEEERGYYEGFSNEGLWPLCHIAHVRPVFRSSDWDLYVRVNQKFADAVIEEAKTRDPVVLVQDYHLALVPKMVREKLPRATILTFWHIPWPNQEVFGICPWRVEILEGLLGSSIIGFHTRFHSQNFIDAVDRYLEARIERETSTISYGQKTTAVRSYPISIDLERELSPTSIAQCLDNVKSRHQMAAAVKIGLGVDRLDYTKGILERLSAVERLFELYPQWIEKFSFIQIASPSRSMLESYQQFETQVRQMCQRINDRYGKNGYRPIHLLIEHHPSESLNEYYRAADVCVVTSLHDGMNLVAKEYVASRDDEQGVLILSQFTGASRELLESLIVNPYNIDQCAEALNAALSLSSPEQRTRMRTMRTLLQKFNIYRWAGHMLTDAASMRKKNRLRDRLKKNKSMTFDL